VKTTTLSAALILVAAGLATQAASAQALPSRAKCRAAAAAKPWAKDFKQIPSTVIDKGVLRDIPYLSYRAGNYELNVYGDPAAPACFEIGIHKELLQGTEARKNGLDLVSSLLDDPEDRKLLASLKPAGEKKVRNGITYEITPPTAEDAYGGWWVSVYNEPLLNTSRATPEELSAITTKRTDVQRAVAVADAKTPYAVDSSTQGRWASGDLADARKSKDVPEEKQAVYAPAFSKKNGRYVPDRTVDDTGYILFICLGSDKHEDMEVIFRECPACKKHDTFFWDTEKKCFIAFTCGTPYENAMIKCPTCGKVPTRVRIKH